MHRATATLVELPSGGGSDGEDDGMAIWNWYLRRGRIDRPTFWLHYFLPLALILAAALALDISTGTVTRTTTSTATTSSTVVHYSPGWIYWLTMLVTAAPLISAQVTRLHDRGRSAWWVLFDVLPIAGFIVLLIQWVQGGTPGPNAYGPPTGSPVTDPPYPAVPATQGYPAVPATQDTQDTQDTQA